MEEAATEPTTPAREAKEDKPKKPPTRWHHFELLSPTRAILRGSRSIRDKRFKILSRGRQASASSAVAIVMAQLFEPRDWSQVLVDRTLEYGDRLFRVSQARNRLGDDEYMNANLLEQEFFVGDYKCRVCIEPGVLSGNVQSENVGAPMLADGLVKFLEAKNFGVLTCQGTSFAVWRHQACGFFLFDPAPVDEQGKRDPLGVACVIRSKAVDGILEALMQNINCKCDSRYCLDKVSLVKVKPIGRGKYQSQCGAEVVIDKKVLQTINPNDLQEAKLDCTKPVPKGEKAERPPPKRNEEPIQKIPLTIEITNCAVQARFASVPLVDQHLKDDNYSYDDLRANVPETLRPLPGDSGLAILHGWTHEGSDVYKAKGAQSAANCVLAIAVKMISPVRTWLRTSLDEILAMGDAIYAEVKALKPTIKTITAADLNDAKIKLDGQKFLILVDLLTVVGTVISKVPSVLSLKQGLEEFFCKDTQGVLECSRMPVAVWSEDDYFYMFDPKSCDMKGFHMVKESKGKGKGKEANPKERKLIGKCCVIRFPDLNALYHHFYKNLDPTQYGDRFTIRRIDLVDDIPGIRDWNSFKPATKGKNWILQGRMNSNYESFKEFSRGIQGLAMPVAALVPAKTIAPSQWSKQDVDDAILEGDAYFNWCIPKVEEEEQEQDKNLTIKRLKKSLYFNKCKVMIDIKDSVIFGNLSESLDGDQLDLERGLKEFLESRQFGVLEIDNQYFAVWKFEEELKDKSKEMAYYLFNDRPNDGFLKKALPEVKKSDNYACVLRYIDVNEIAAILKDLMFSDDEQKTNDFYIHEVIVLSVSEPMSDEDIEKDKETPLKPQLKNYTARGENGAVLAGNFNQANEALFKKDTRDTQQAANSLVTLAMRMIFDPYLWTPDVLDDILMMGDKLTLENLKNLEGYDEEDPSNTRNYLVPHEINREISFGVNEMSVDIEEEIAMGKFDDILSSMEELFKNSKSGIFRYTETIMPIWREENIYFTMDPKGRDGDTAAVYWFIDLESFTAFLTECVENTDGDFIIDGINVENTYVEAERPEEEVLITDTQWYNFNKTSHGIWKIDSTAAAASAAEHTTDEVAEVKQEKPREKETAAICVMAIVFSKVYEPRHWSAEVLDEITVTGETLHARSAARLGKDKSFRPNEIISEFFLSNRRIDLSIHDCVQAGTLVGENPRVENITSGVMKFFEQFTSGCLTLSGSMNLAIWKYDDCYYCFEPKVSLTRFENMELLNDYLATYADTYDDFEITSVNIIDWNKLPPWKFDPSPAVRPSNLPPLNAYCRLPGKARAILRASTHQASEIFAENIRGRQTASNCISALAMSVIKSSITWTRKTLDEILAIGVQTHRETLKTLNKTNLLKPTDIIRVFHIGVNVLAADVQEGTVAGIVAYPPPEPEVKGKKGTKKKSGKDSKKGKAKRIPPPPPPPILLEAGINKFFENHNAGILVTGRFMVAIWKECGVYFVYDPRPRNSEGLKTEDESEGTSCAVWFACKEPLYDLVSANINDDEKYAKFEISRVIIKTVSIEPLPSPAGYKAINENVASPTKDSCPMPPVLPADLQYQQSRNSEKLDVDLESSFECIDKELSILLGESHMSERRFPLENRGFQSSAIAAVAIVVAALHAPSTWTSCLIDAIIKYGDILHTECARLACPGSRNLSPSELLDVFVVGDVRATIRLRRNLTAGISLEYDLANALKLFFTTNVFGILHTANYAIPIMEHWGKYYFLDPSERNRFKKDSFEGAACLIKCESLFKLAKVIVQVCAFKEPTVYTLNAVEVLDLRFFTR